jgi:hypothetical protein
MKMPPEELLNDSDLRTGAQLFSIRLNEIVESEDQVSDVHGAFEFYAMRKYSLGNSAGNHVVGGKGDLGIDFYSQKDHKYHIGQCKIPDADWLESNPTKPKQFGTQALSDTRDALRYLLGESDLKPNEQVKRLYSLIHADKSEPDFSIVFYIVVYGRLNPRAADQVTELRSQYEHHRVAIVVVQMDNLVSEFLIGSNHTAENIEFDLQIRKGELLRAHNYCYFLANAADLFRAFSKFGWRLFDLNLRYEVRNSSVNGEIIQSLRHSRSRKNFHHYNNGLIIVAGGYSINDNEGSARLTGAQIVNGLQTLKSIYNAVADKQVDIEELKADCVVPVKVIKTSEAKFVDAIVRATNNQNPMAQRNLRSNNSEQKVLRKGFQMLSPRWFYQLKEGEWDSLTSEQARFFEQVVGHKASEFKPVPTRKSGRVIDNQEAAKAWLCFIGYADEAGDRVTHFFSEDKIYDLAFGSRPSKEYWELFGKSLDWDKLRLEMIEWKQGEASQYLLAYFIWQYVNSFVPSPQKYRELALNEGVQAGRIKKASGSFTSTDREQDAYLSENTTYQTWRLMANMKELLTEIVSQVLTRRYGPLDGEVCAKLLLSFEAAQYRQSADTREVAQMASAAPDLASEEVFGRILRMLHFVCQQFWEDKKQQLLSTSRLRTYLLKRDMAESVKALVWEYNERINLDRAWKPQGKKFLDSLPGLR